MTAFVQTKWDLSDAFSSNSAFEDAVAEIKNKATLFEQLKGKLPSSKNEMMLALKSYEEIHELNNRLEAYAEMLFSEDTRSQESKARKDMTEQISADIGNKLLFFELWWKNLDDDKASCLTPENEDYAYYLSRLRKYKPYTLDEKVEQAINIKDVTGIKAMVNLYEQITNAFTYDIRGESKKLVRSDLSRLTNESNPEKRVEAYKALMEKYAENKNILGEIYRTIIKDYKNDSINLRKYHSPASVMNLANDVSDKSIETLLSVCRKNSDVFQDFFRIKAKFLDMDKMSRYHIYAPLQQSADKIINYQDGIKMVLDTFASFDEKFGEYAKNIFKANHVDSELREGKQSGAYCMGISPKIVPYLLLNYNGTLSGLSTIAHEFFHGIHFQLASKHSPLTYSAPLGLAEATANFGEMLVSERIMEMETDPQVKMDLIVKNLSRNYGGIQRQAYFAIFERDAHDAVGNNGVTIDDLDKIYLSNLREHFGDAVEVPEEFKHEWMCIPHFYRSPFYVNSYSFGGLLTNSLYNRYKIEGDSFKKDYVKLLSYGGSASPHKILSEIGIDMESADFWQGGYNILRDKVKQLRKI